MPITTTITFADIVAYHEAELDETREAYDEAVNYATDEYGDERAEWGEDLTAIVSILDEHAKTLQQRINLIQQVSDDYDGSEFVIKMLSGRELSDIETDLRMTAQQRDTDPQNLTSERKMETVDRAVVSAPEGFPTDDDGDPMPSDAPNPLALSLHEQVQQFNQAGDTDFRAEGFADELLAALPATSGTPSDAESPSDVSATIDDASAPSGDSSSTKRGPDADDSPATK